MIAFTAASLSDMGVHGGWRMCNKCTHSRPLCPSLCCVSPGRSRLPLTAALCPSPQTCFNDAPPASLRSLSASLLRLHLYLVSLRLRASLLLIQSPTCRESVLRFLPTSAVSPLDASLLSGAALGAADRFGFVEHPLLCAVVLLSPRMVTFARASPITHAGFKVRHAVLNATSSSGHSKTPPFVAASFVLEGRPFKRLQLLLASELFGLSPAV